MLTRNLAAMIEAGLVTALGIMFILFRLNIRRIAGYALIVDITLTLGLVWIFQGTYAGMMTGLFAGCVISVMLTMIKRSVGYDRMAFIRVKGELFPRLIWKHYKGVMK